MRRVLLLPTLLSLLVARAALPESDAGLKAGEKAPAFTLKTINPEQCGVKTVALKQFLGVEPELKKRAVMLSFSASYCLPCQKEAVRLKALAKSIEAAGVQVLSVVIDRDAEGQAQMTKLLRDDLALPFPVLLDKFGILARRYKASSLPYLVVIDPATSNVTEVHVGYDKEALDALLRKLGVKL